MFRSALFQLLSIIATHSLDVVVQGVKTVGNEAVPGLENGMDYIRLGDSDLVVSKVCMGTMTFGGQNTLEESVELLNRAFDHYGINFLDTAEMYPAPLNPATQGDTDRVIAKFLKGRNREDVIIATKVTGRGAVITWMPRREANTPAALTREQIIDSVDASLERLEVEYIDLLQIHWPDRYIGGLFGYPDFTPSRYEAAHPKTLPPVDFEEQLAALQELIQAGKIRYVGLANESPFGLCSMAQLAKSFPDLYPKIVSIQNNYSLVHRKDFESGLAEACYHYNVGLLAYSPLAGGSLTGKYRTTTSTTTNDGDNCDNKDESESSESESSCPTTTTTATTTGRLTMFPGFMDRYLGSQNEAAVSAYCDVAQEAGLSPAQMALSWCYHNELVASTIIGATSMEKLDENLKAYDIHLTDETSSKIGEVYKIYTDPTKP